MIGHHILLVLLLIISVNTSLADQVEGGKKFSPAAVPESSSYIHNGMSSGENYANFYAKTKDIDNIDLKILEKLRLSQLEIDNADRRQSEDMSGEEEEKETEDSDDLFADFTLRKSLGSV